MANLSLNLEGPTGKLGARRFFTPFQEILPMPNLIEAQIRSYKWFWEKGLKELFAEINSIKDFTGKNLELFFGDYYLDKPKYDEKTAKEMTKTKTIKRKVLSITELSKDIKEGKIKELKIVLKADVAGSLEAIKNSLKNLSTEEVEINVIHEGVGDINESDINMAVASIALVIGFRIKASAEVMNLARRENIKIQIYDIIYQLIDDYDLWIEEQKKDAGQ